MVAAAAKAADYEEGFGLKGCDLTRPIWWAAYIRQSLEEQAQNNRIPEYMLTCARMAKEHAVVVPREYIIVDHESSEYLDRRHMRYLRIELIAGRRIAGVMFTHQGRLSADPLHQLYFERECRYYGVSFLFGDAPSGADWASTAGRQMMAQANWLRVTSNRDGARAGNIGRVLKGMVPAGQASYGYRYRRDAEIAPNGRVIVKRAWWEINDPGPDGSALLESPAWVVAQIFAWVGAEGRSLYWVANRLNEMGIPAPEGGRWSPPTVGTLVRRRCYTGSHAYNTNLRVPNPHRPLGDITAEIKRTVVRPKPEQEWVGFKVPALVSPELWQKAHDTLKERGRGRGKQGKTIQALLRGRIFCPRCGRPMIVRRDSRHKLVYYHCSRYFRAWTENPCTYSRFLPGSLDDIAWQAVCALLDDDAWLELQLASAHAQSDNIARLIRLEQFKIGQARARVAKVREGFEGEIYNLAEAKRRIAEHEGTIARAEQEIERLRKRTKAPDIGLADIEAVKGELKRLRDKNLSQAAFEEKADLIVKLGIRVYPSEDLKSVRISCGLNLRSDNTREREDTGECGKVMLGTPHALRQAQGGGKAP
ncbi:MAG: recombinase family protein [Dehalococcoidia bacterium]